MKFTLGSVPPEQANIPEFWFVFQQRNLLAIKRNESFSIPNSDDIDSFKTKLSNIHYIGNLGKYSCCTARYPDNQSLPGDLESLSFIQLDGQIEENFIWIASRAIQIIDWDETHKFCGSCGTPTITKTDEHAKVCPKCGHMCFSRISPAIIVAVTKGNKILLVRKKSLSETNLTNFFTVISGFVEPGETLEECLKREVKEEVGIEVKNINYFGSQPWPYPNSLMIAFTAEYDNGELNIEQNELLHAEWFTADDIPRMPIKPVKITIARQLIDGFIEKEKRI